MDGYQFTNHQIRTLRCRGLVTRTYAEAKLIVFDRNFLRKSTGQPESLFTQLQQLGDLDGRN
jgi:hypothetical protein